MIPPGALVAVPELPAEGPGRMLKAQGNTLALRFLASGAEMTRSEKEVVRYCLLPGTRVRVEGDGSERRISSQQIQRDAKTGLLVYTVAGESGEVRLREDAIALVPASADPWEQLLSATWHDLRPGHPEAWAAGSYCAREELLAWRDSAWARCGGVSALAGARVVPLPHQLLAARSALADRQIRFLFADEVGLGKTIEAGLVLQSLLAMQPSLRVLVVVPGALVSQWFLELFVKFGGRRFLMLDRERLAKYPGNPWKDEQFVISSTRAVEEMDAKGALRLAQSQWDVLVVDECHRMHPQGVLYKRIAVLSKKVPHVLLLSATPARRHADAYLGLLALLQPQVWRTDDKGGLTRRFARHDRLGRLLERTIAATDGFKALAREWQQELEGDGEAERLAKALSGGGKGERDALVAYVRAQYRLDRRVVRNRRASLARLAAELDLPALSLATRAEERLRYAPDAPELAVRKALEAYRAALVKEHRKGGLPPRLQHWILQLELAAACHPAVLERLCAMRSSVIADPEGYADYRRRAVPGETVASVLRSDLSENEIATHVAISAACHADPAVEEAVLDVLHRAALAWDKAAEGKGTARLRAIQDRLKAFWSGNPREKVLVFTNHGLAVAPVAEFLADAFPGTVVETYGAHQDTLGREESSRAFQEDDRCSLLVCDPLGGEGRNFQFVSVVAHHDLPWSIAAVEQRIGRVDRIGRDGEVPSWVVHPGPEGAVDAAWAELLSCATGVFRQPASGLEFVADQVEAGALEAVLSGGAPALVKRIGELSALIEAERKAGSASEENAFGHEPEAFRAAARQARALAEGRPPVDACLRWLKACGGSVKRLEEHPRPFSLRHRWHDQPEEGVFEREAALLHPRFSFFSLGNHLIDRLCDEAAQATWCRAAAWRRKPTPGLKRWDGLRVTLELVYDLVPIAAAGLPLASLRRLLMRVPPRRELLCVRFGESGAVEIEADPAVQAAIAVPYDTKAGDLPLSQAGSRDLWSRLLLGGRVDQVLAWQASVAKACSEVEVRAADMLPALRDQPLRDLEVELGEGIRLARVLAEGAAKRGEDDAGRLHAEVEEEERQAQALLAALRGARLEVAGLAWVQVG